MSPIKANDILTPIKAYIVNQFLKLKIYLPIKVFSFRALRMSFMQMAKLERLARNGSGKESLVAKLRQ